MPGGGFTSTINPRNALGFAPHGTNAAFARPTGFAQVVWVGSVQPTNLAAGDIWIRSA